MERLKFDRGGAETHRVVIGAVVCCYVLSLKPKTRLGLGGVYIYLVTDVDTNYYYSFTFTKDHLLFVVSGPIQQEDMKIRCHWVLPYLHQVNKKSYLCAVKITVVEENENWWYLSCTCQQEVVKVKNMFKCPKEIKLIPVTEKRFKVVVPVGDSTEAFNFVLHYRAVKQIVGQTAMKMIFDNPTSVEKYTLPPYTLI
ncbi:uncharacterized protein LOC141684913 [Apium graveolens]|uniref:uncharacterized protein LOC141684913 n=1 Tax=Apium graveolens TaxID=4045 RepID=UPI003D7BDEC2